MTLCTEEDFCTDEQKQVCEPDSGEPDEMDAEGSMDAEGAVVRKPPHDKADILVALATVSGYKAWRFKTSGSVFVRTLVYVFNNYSDKLHLMDMLTKVSHTVYCLSLIKGKVLPYSSLSVGSRADPSVQAISPQVIFKIIPAVGCHYFPPGPVSYTHLTLPTKRIV